MQITLRVCGLALAGIVLVPSASRAAETQPEWITRPSRTAIMGVWPREALRTGVGGMATVGCTVTPQGGVRDCKVVSEKPAGTGFGAAALALTSQFMFKPATREGAPVEGHVEIPIRFEMDAPTTGSIIPGAHPTLGDETRRVYAGPLPWSQAPTVAELVAAYPPKARAERASGHVSVDCRFTAAGKLADCATLREEPAGLGFGHAAHTLTERFQGPTTDTLGRSMAGGHTQLAFAFPVEALNPGGPPIGQPRWTALPNPADLAAVLPAQARAAGVLQARVVLQCRVAETGLLADCTVETETPGALGYGDAALTLARRFRVSLWTEEGLPTVGGQLRLPLRFDYSTPPPKP